jgi:hypothetical protein
MDIPVQHMKHPILLLTLITSLFLLSCNNANNKEISSALTDTISFTGLAGDSVKLVKTAAINFKVKDVEQSIREISNLSRQYGGMLVHQNFESVEGERNELKRSSDSLLVITSFTPKADVTVRVPSEQLEDFIFHITQLGYLTVASQIDVNDKSLSYLQNFLKQQNRNDVLSQASKKGEKVNKVATIDLRDEAIEKQIANRAIDADVNYSTVNVNIFQNPLIKKEIVANYVISDYRLPFSQRLVISISAGWYSFLAFVLAVVHLWMFLVLAILAYTLYKYLLKNRKLKIFTS